jgi:hypothetical protein
LTVSQRGGAEKAFEVPLSNLPLERAEIFALSRVATVTGDRPSACFTVVHEIHADAARRTSVKRGKNAGWPSVGIFVTSLNPAPRFLAAIEGWLIHAVHLAAGDLAKDGNHVVMRFAFSWICALIALCNRRQINRSRLLKHKKFTARRRIKKAGRDPG